MKNMLLNKIEVDFKIGEITSQQADAILVNYPHKSKNERDYYDYPLLQEIVKKAGGNLL